MAENKETKYVIDNPKLMSEWNWDKNTPLGLNPQNLTLGSEKKAWWKCSKDHEWQARINARNAGNGCPYCSGRYAIKGVNDLHAVNPTVTSQWNYEKNGALKPTDVMPNSNKKVWWKCSKGHEWYATINSRNQGSGCPHCAGQKVIQGVNDLQTTNPTLASEWNYGKNGKLTPTEVMAGSEKRVWWKCSKGHEWQATIASRNRGNGCPYCAGRKTIKGENDLQTINPTVASQWNYEKNGALKPTDLMPNSGKKVWWKCQKGHEWQAKITHRNSGSGCPICASEQKTSFPEYAFVYYLEKAGLTTIHTYKQLGYELDVYIPVMKIAIEYDGAFWHRDITKKDLEKNAKCYHDGVKLYRIREHGLPPLNSTSIDYVVQRNQKNLGKVIKDVLSEITQSNIDVDLNRDVVEIENLREHAEKKNSLLATNPAVASEWNHEKNGLLTPSDVSSNSNKKVWWKCQHGHEWQTTINARNRGNGCPYCAGRKK